MAIGATATTDAGIGPALAELGPAAISSLSRLVGGVLAGGGAGLVAFLGTLLMRSQTGAVTEGRLPERDDIRFRYDDTTRGLAIYQQDTGGQERLVFSGQANPEDNLFRNEAGEPIGIRLASGVLIDPYAFPGYFEEEDEGEDAGAAPRTRTVAEAQRDKARLCPDWSKENIKGRSPGAVAYQSQIAHMPPEWDIKFRAVRYDGCDEATGDLSDAKFGFAKFMTGPDTWYPWFRGVAKLERQMKRQSDNAPDRTIDWHFSEDGPARFFAARAERPPNIVVHYTKPMWQPSHEDMYRSHIVGTRKGAPMPWPLLRSPSSTMLPTQRYLAGPT
jgi:hypothetical protein